MTAADIIRILDLKPLTEEGGYYRETYRSKGRIAPLDRTSDRAFSTAIYYLLTPDQFSALHRVKSDEIFHFYCGDPVEMLTLSPNGDSEVLTIGNRFEKGEQPQVIVPAGIWQGARLKDGGSWALLGTTVAPGFEFADFELGNQESLIAEYSKNASMIRKLSRG